MKKVKTLKILIDLAILLLINVVYFGVWGLDHSASAWISYVFIHFSVSGRKGDAVCHVKKLYLYDH